MFKSSEEREGLLVNHSRGQYPINFASFSIDFIHNNDFLIVDKALSKIANWPGSRTFFFYPEESHKTLETVSKCADWLVQSGASRSSRIIAIGGGALQDVSTVLSSLFMRGIPWVYIPSTTNSMVDSCVGGKSAINTLNGKNVLGNFYPPHQVLVDIDLLRTLPTVDYVGGLFEAIKIIYAHDRLRLPAFLAKLEINNFKISEDLIRESLEAKVEIIEEDEFDQGRRLLLNYGHTFGHALERALDYKVNHGTAVGLGMLAANRMRGRIEGTLELDIAIRKLLYSLPLKALLPIKSVNWSEFELGIKADKKNTGGTLTFVLPNSGGDLELVRFEQKEEALEIARETMKEVLDEWEKIS